jgi:hypothetical protein
MDAIASAMIDKTSFSVASLAGQPDDRAYWLARSPDERLEAVEFLRQLNYGYDPATTRLRRVLEVAELKGG